MNVYLGTGVFLGFWAIVGAHHGKYEGNAVLYALLTVFFWPIVILREILIIRRIVREKIEAETKDSANPPAGCPTRRYMEETLRGRKTDGEK